MNNPDLPPDNRAALEAKVTAFLLGELSAEEAAALRQAMSQDAALAKLHERLRRTLDLLRATAATSAGEIAEQSAPLRLSPRRREALLAHFKTVSPKELARPRGRKVSFWVEMAAAAAILLIAVGVALPKLTNREQARRADMGRGAIVNGGEGRYSFLARDNGGVPALNGAPTAAIQANQAIEGAANHYARVQGAGPRNVAGGVVSGVPVELAGGIAGASSFNASDTEVLRVSPETINKKKLVSQAITALRPGSTAAIEAKPASPPKSSIYVGKAVQSGGAMDLDAGDPNEHGGEVVRSWYLGSSIVSAPPTAAKPASLPNTSIYVGKTEESAKTGEADQQRWDVNVAALPFDSEMVTEVFPMHSLNAAQVSRDLYSLIPPGDKMSTSDAGNAIVMTGKQADVKRMAQTISELDKTGNGNLQVFRLQNADSKAVASELKDVFADTGTTGSAGGFNIATIFGSARGGRGGGGAAGAEDARRAPPRVNAVADELNNAIVVSAPADYMSGVSNLIHVSDDNGNWVGGAAPGHVGDSVIFAGATGLAPTATAAPPPALDPAVVARLQAERATTNGGIFSINSVDPNWSEKLHSAGNQNGSGNVAINSGSASGRAISGPGFAYSTTSDDIGGIRNLNRPGGVISGPVAGGQSTTAPQLKTGPTMHPTETWAGAGGKVNIAGGNNWDVEGAGRIGGGGGYQGGFNESLPPGHLSLSTLAPQERRNSEGINSLPTAGLLGGSAASGTTGGGGNGEMETRVLHLPTNIQRTAGGIAGGGLGGFGGGGIGGLGGGGQFGGGGGTNMTGGIPYVTPPREVFVENGGVLGYFTNAGVNVSSNGAFAFYNSQSGDLLVRGSKQDLDKIERSTELLNKTPQAAQADASFGSVTPNDAKGAGATLYNGAIGAQAGTAPSFTGPSTYANPSGIFPGAGQIATKPGQAGPAGSGRVVAGDIGASGLVGQNSSVIFNDGNVRSPLDVVTVAAYGSTNSISRLDGVSPYLEVGGPAARKAEAITVAGNVSADRGNGVVTRQFVLTNAESTDVASELRGLGYVPVASAGKGSPIFSAVPDARTQTVTVTASKETMDQIGKIVGEMDKQDSGHAGTYLYSAQNSDVQELLSPLHDLFPQQNGRRSSTSSQQDPLYQRQTSSTTQSTASAQSTIGARTEGTEGTRVTLQRIGGFGNGSGTSQGAVTGGGSNTVTAVGDAYAGSFGEHADNFGGRVALIGGAGADSGSGRGGRDGGGPGGAGGGSTGSNAGNTPPDINALSTSTNGNSPTLFVSVLGDPLQPAVVGKYSGTQDTSALQGVPLVAQRPLPAAPGRDTGNQGALEASSRLAMQEARKKAPVAASIDGVTFDDIAMVKGALPGKDEAVDAFIVGADGPVAGKQINGLRGDIGANAGDWKLYDEASKANVANAGGGFNGLYWKSLPSTPARERNGGEIANLPGGALHDADVTHIWSPDLNGGALANGGTLAAWNNAGGTVTPLDKGYTVGKKSQESEEAKKSGTILGDIPIIGGFFKSTEAAAVVAADAATTKQRLGYESAQGRNLGEPSAKSPTNHAFGNNSTEQVYDGPIGAQAGSKPHYFTEAEKAQIAADTAARAKAPAIAAGRGLPALPSSGNRATNQIIAKMKATTAPAEPADIQLHIAMPADQVLNEIYGPMAGRSQVSASAGPAAVPKDSVITLNTESNLTKSQAILALATELGRNGITVVPIADKFFKVVPTSVASTVGGAIFNPQSPKRNLDAPPPKPASPPPVPQAEVQTRENAFSTFSLNVSDVSFRLAAASLEKGILPDASTVRSEEFINAFNYRDSEPGPGAPVGFAWQRAGYPFAHNRDLLRFAVKTASEGRQADRALNLVLLLDKSGSMERADRVAIIGEALRVLGTQLKGQDTVSVVVFARTARLFADGVGGGRFAALAAELEALTPEGGTNLEEAMRLAYEAALRHYLANGENRVVLLTDGAANLGDVEPEDLKKRVEAYRAQGVALDCFGVGWEDYNDNLLEVLSRSGGGRYGFVNTPEEAATGFAGQLAGALRVAASDVKVQVEFNPQRVISYRQIGYAKDQLKKEEFRDNSVKAAQMAVAESGNALYTVELNPAGQGPICTVHVRYRTPGTQDYYEHEWAVPYTGAAEPLDKASPPMRLAATASAFAEWLAGSPYAGEVTLNKLQGYLRGVPEFYGADARPKLLETMLREAGR